VKKRGAESAGLLRGLITEIPLVPKGDEGEDPYAIAATRLLIFPGCRLNEIVTSRRAYVALAGRYLSLPDSKTGARVVHLDAPALDVLARIERRPENPWVICGKKPRSRRTDLQPRMTDRYF
jgi:integrase